MTTRLELVRTAPNRITVAHWWIPDEGTACGFVLQTDLGHIALQAQGFAGFHKPSRCGDCAVTFVLRGEQYKRDAEKWATA